MRSKTIFFSIFLFMLVATGSKAAGFDCARANTRPERLICSNKKLEVLDEKLTTAYRRAYKTTSNKQELKAKQVEWLKQRDACETSKCMAEKYQSRIAALVKTRADFSWLKEYAGKTTNSLAWDKRFGTLIESISPITKQDFGLDEKNLAGTLRGALGGPPDDVSISENRYITFSACQFHFCPEKGFVWIDLLESTAVAAIIHYDSRRDNFSDHPVLLVFSNDVEGSALPQRFKADLNKWLRQKTDNKITKVFINAGGEATNL